MPIRVLRLSRMLMLATGLWSMPGHAADNVASVESCALCHGKDGVSTLAASPSLAAQPDGFLQWQMVFFRLGARKSELMQAVGAGLSDDDIRRLAGHFSAMAPPPPPASDKLNPEKYAQGERLAAEHRCASCHKDDYSGDKAAARTAHQREDYLLKSLKDFKSGVRRGGGVAAMADAVYSLQETELEALAHYMAQLK